MASYSPSGSIGQLRWCPVPGMRLQWLVEEAMGEEAPGRMNICLHTGQSSSAFSASAATERTAAMPNATPNKRTCCMRSRSFPVVVLMPRRPEGSHGGSVQQQHGVCLLQLHGGHSCMLSK